MKKYKFLILIISVLIISILMISCGKNEESVAKKPIYPPDVKGDIVQNDNNLQGTINLDESKLINKINSIKSVTPGEKIPEGYHNPGFMPDTSGLSVVAESEGASFWYSGILNLNNLKNENIIEFVTPRDNNFNVNGVTVTMVDVHDPSRTISVRWWGTNNKVSYMLVGCNGIEAGNNNEGEGTGGGYALDAPRPVYGSLSNRSVFDGNWRWWPDARTFHFYFDIDENAIYAETGYRDGGLGSKQGKYMILDVDNPVQMGNEKLCFKGFTTGEIYLKVRFDKIVKEGKMIITKIGGKDLTSKDVIFSKNDVIRLDMDYDYYEDTLPDGKTGTFYKLPQSLIGDICWGGHEIRTSLKDSGVDITDKIKDGGFVPEHSGSYLLWFSSVDIYGFNIEKLFHINIKDEIPPITISTEEFNPVLFTQIKLPSVTIAGGSGNVHTDIKYIHNEKEIKPNILGKYYIDEPGEIKICIKAKDYLGTIKEETKSVAIQGVNIIKITNGYFPEALRVGSKYVIPEFEAISYIDGINQLTKNVEIDTGSGYEEYTESSVIVPSNEYISFKFIGGKGSKNEITKEYKVKTTVVAEQGDLSGCITGNKITKSQQIDGIEVDFEKDGYFSWVNSLAGLTPEFSFTYLPEKADYDLLNINLTDTINSNISVTVKVIPTDKGIMVQTKDLNGKSFSKLIPGSTTEDKCRIQLFFDSDMKAITGYGKLKYVPVTICDDGNIFEGFRSGGVRISVSAEGIKDADGVKGNAGIILNRVGNQELALRYVKNGDFVGPQIITSEMVSSTKIYALGSEFLIPSAKSFDVLQYFSSIKVEFIDPDGNSVILPDGNSCRSSQKVILDKQGNYMLTYIAKDSVRQTTKISYSLKVRDTFPPVITVPEMVKECRSGSKWEFIKPDITDNISNESNIKVYAIIRDTTLKNYVIEEGGTFTFTMQGKYKIFYYAVDEAGNIGVSESVYVSVY